MHTPTVSVIIPCHNQGQYIAQAVASIARQSYGDFEIIIVDDASDNSRTIRAVASVAKLPKTSLVAIRARNVAAARNCGIRQARGRYILTLDADDYFRPQFLASALAVLEQRAEIGLVACWTQNFGYSHSVIRPTAGPLHTHLTRNEIPACALFRRTCWEAVGGYDEQFSCYEGWDFWLSIASKGWQAHILDARLFYQRTRALDDEERQNRLQMLRQLIDKHRALYEQYTADVVIQMDEQLRQANNLLRFMRLYRLFDPKNLPRRMKQAWKALRIVYAGVVKW